MFTVTGSLPVLPSESQDTSANAPPHSSCNPAKLAADLTEGYSIAAGFYVIGAPDAGALLRNFLAGKGEAINLPNGSTASQDLLANPAFKSLNKAVQDEIQRQLNMGNTTITLQQPPLKRIGLYEPADLQWSFGGTQGLKVTGNGSLTDGTYTGTLTYTIEDSYGFTALDHFHGFGDDMRYLQTVCGNPPHLSGAQWFPDSVTITVDLNLPVDQH